MKNLFIVGSKLLGIICVYWALITIPQIVFATALLSDKPSPPGSVPPEVAILIALIAVLASILLAILLLFKTDRLAQFLKIPSDTTLASAANSELIIRVGLVLIGIYILIDAIPVITRFIIESFQYKDYIYSLNAVGRLVSLILRLCMAMYIVVYSKHATQIILRFQKI